jgi:hypothetical protein
MKIVQIGSNKGYDDLTEIVTKNKMTDVEILILVEPQSEFNDSLSLCYLGYNYFIENIIINVDEQITKCKLYSCEHKEISSVIPNHLRKHNQYFFDEKEIECMTINSLLKKYSLYNLDLLFIDAEGLDEEIIKNIDFELFNIKKIIYENLHINNDYICDFLVSKNYIVNKNVLTNGWSNEAIKQN